MFNCVSVDMSGVCFQHDTRREGVYKNKQNFIVSSAKSDIYTYKNANFQVTLGSLNDL